MQTRHVIFVNRYFHPDHSATSQLVSDLAFHLASRGWTVEVVTSRQSYDDPRARLLPRERVRGVTIHRVATTTFGRMFLAGRAVDYVTFYVSAFITLMKHARRGTVVVAMTDPPLISVVAAFAAFLSRAILVNWIQDLFPEVAEALGVLKRGASLLRRPRDWSLRRARTNVVLGELMANRIGAILPRSRAGSIAVRHNWAVDELVAVPKTDNPLRAEWSLGDRFVVAYSGNLGRAHDFSAIIAAMHELPEITFLIVGGGAQLETVKKAAADLANVQFRPYQPRELLSASLSAADAHLVTLQPDLEGLIVPSKLYGVLAAARPAIFIGDPEGEAARIIREYDCGLIVRNDDTEALVTSLRGLAADPKKGVVMGMRGRALYESH
ncbi:MAG: glycosyltransferase family 4 protein, partial [Acidobacteriota bacterium]